MKVNGTTFRNKVTENGKYKIMQEKVFKCTICGEKSKTETILSKELLSGKQTSEITIRIIHCPRCGNVIIPDVPYLNYKINDIKKYVLENHTTGDEYNYFAAIFSK